MKFSDLRPGDYIEYADDIEEVDLVICVLNDSFTVLLNASKLSFEQHKFNSTRFGMLWSDVKVHRGGIEIFKGEQFDVIRKKRINPQFTPIKVGQ